jgi:hypothetical protein
MTRYFCNECSSDKTKGCSIKWPSSWGVEHPPRGGVCDSEDPKPVWKHVKKDKITGGIIYVMRK